MIRPAAALLGKELGHHGLAVVVAAVFVASGLAIRWFTDLEDDAPTLISSATGLAYYGLPLVAIWLAERLVVADRVDRTHEFLAALPVSPLARDTLRLVLGAAVLVTLATAGLLLTALLASRREGVPLLWLAQAWLQMIAVVLAWHGVAFGVAHFGRWRWLVWWAWAMVAMVLDAWVEHPWRTVWWTAPLADPLDQARSVVPWSAFPVAAAWALGGWSLGLGLATWRAGALPQRWFEPPTAVQRATVVGTGMLLAIVATQASDMVPDTDRWSELRAVPSETAVVRIAGDPGGVLDQVGAEAAAVLDQLGPRVGVQAWPPLVLLRSRSEEGRAVRVAPGADRSRVLLVDPDVDRDTLVREVVTEALWARATDAARRDDDAWPLRGAAAWLRPDDVVRRRAAHAGGFDPAERWLEVERRYGHAVSEGIAWAGLEALEQAGGEDAVWEVLEALLGPRRSDRFSGLVRLRWTLRGDAVPRISGVERGALEAGWEAALSDPVAGPALPEVELTEEQGQVVARWSGPLPEGAVLRWVEVDPLHAGPMPGAEVEEVRLEPRQRSHPLPVDARARLAVELAVPAPAIAGRLTTGWGARR